MGRYLKGHLFLFDPFHRQDYAPSSGLRLLLIFVLLEFVLGPRLWLFGFLGLPPPPAWLRVPVLLGLALALIQYFARLRLSQVGLYGWRRWSLTEKFYFLQVVLLANAVLGIIFADRLRMILADRVLWGRATIVLVTYLLWGFYQEVVYRGILQAELVRRWGAWPGILVGNALYTFGPLHSYHFSGNNWSQALPMLAGIFAIGLFFGVLFRRSGNLGMVGVFHGLGDFYITGLPTLGP